MKQKIQRGYCVPGLDKFLIEKKKGCPTCNMTSKPPLCAPSAALLPDEKCQTWQLDYVGQFPPDSKTGHRFD